MATTRGECRIHPDCWLGDGHGGDHAVERRTEPTLPPYPVSFLVRYEGTSRFRLGDCPEWIEPGMVGEVIRIEQGMPAMRAVLGDDDEPVDGWSVVRFHGPGPEHVGCTRAVTMADIDRYPAA